MAKSTGKRRAHQLTKDLESSIKSIGSDLEGNSTVMAAFNEKLQTTRDTLSSVGKVIANTKEISKEQVDIIRDTMTAYADMESAIVNISRQYKRGKISAEQYADGIKNASENYNELKSHISSATKAGKDVNSMFDEGSEASEEQAKALQLSIAKTKLFDESLGKLTDNIPLLSELTTVIKSAKEGGAGLTLSLFAMGAAAGSLVYNLGLVGDKIGTTARWDAKLAKAEGMLELRKQALSMGRVVVDLGNSFESFEVAGLTNWMDEDTIANFNLGLDQAAVTFAGAAKHARFGEGMGPFGFDLAELNLAGLSAESISKSMSEIAAKTGQVPSEKFAANMALVEERTGASVSSLVDGFMRVDGLSADSALNMVEGIRDMAKSANVDLGTVMKELEDSQATMLSLGIRSTEELVKQVGYAASLGVSYDKVSSAGKSMVLNYKDSIKSEMRLSSILGRQVDLSEVRSAFAAGGKNAIPNALKALKAQGLDPSSMDIFQRQALQEATGMDDVTLSKIFQGTGKEPEDLKEKSAQDTNKKFLSGLQDTLLAVDRENQKLAGLASLKALERQTKQAEELQDIIGKHAFGIYDDMHKIHLLEFQKTIHTGFIQGVAALVGGLLFAVPQLVLAASGKGGLSSLFSKGKEALTGPMSKGMKIGGGAIAGILGGVSGFMNKKEANGDTGASVGAGLIQGGLAAGGAALGAAFGGPLGMMIGGFLGNTLGGWINDNAPGVADRFGKVWNSVAEKIKPVIKAVDKFIQKLGFEDGLGSLFSFFGEWIITGIIAPFEYLISTLGLFADMGSVVVKLFQGDWTGAWSTFKSGISDFIDNILAPFEGIINTIKRAFAGLNNMLVDTWFGDALGLSEIKMPASIKTQTKEVIENAVEENIDQIASADAMKVGANYIAGTSAITTDTLLTKMDKLITAFENNTQVVELTLDGKTAARAIVRYDNNSRLSNTSENRNRTTG